MKKIKIAQIGTSRNSHGNDIWHTLCELSDYFEVVGYALPENEETKFPERAKDFLPYKRMTVEEILNNPEIEAVAVETEEIYLLKYAQMVADSGKALHMEKPGSPNLDAFKRLIDTVKAKGSVFHTGYMYRYNPVISDVIERVKNGEIGRVVSVDAQMSGFHPDVYGEFLSNFPSGELFFLGCHLIDIIVQLLGKPDEVIPLSYSSTLKSVPSDDVGMAVFKYKNAVATAKVNGAEMGGYSRRQVVIAGEKGTIEIKPLEVQYPIYPDLATTVREYKSDEWNDAGSDKTVGPYHRYKNMMTSFAKMVCGEIKNPYTYDYELLLFETVMKACEK